MDTIQINIVNGSIQAVSMWHPIDGKWVLLTQMVIDGKTRYYINGVEMIPVLAKQEIIKE